MHDRCMIDAMPTMTSTSKRRTALLCVLLFCTAISSECSSAVATDEDPGGGILVEDESTADTNDDVAVADKVADGDGDRKVEDNDFLSQEEIILDTKSDLQHTPPTHFQITAHLQTNLLTGYSYFLPTESLPTSFAHLPFLECGAVGSTTEKLPLVGGVFRHVPHTAVVPRREDLEVVLENLDAGIKTDDSTNGVQEEENMITGLDELNQDDADGKSNGMGNNGPNPASGEDVQNPKRPSPPKYVVALSPLEITVGGGRNGNGNNETKKFNPGDVIFMEDTWWGAWDDIDEESTGKSQLEEGMKGYIMRASPEDPGMDLNVLMLTVPNAIHRHWKNAQYAIAMAKREQQQLQRKAQKQQQEQSSQHQSAFVSNAHEFGTRQPWWKRPASFLQKPNSNINQQEIIPSLLPKPCSLESDPAFANPSTSSTTLSQHFTQHFTSLLRKSTNPHPTFLPHHHQDLLLPILAQTVAATIGGAASLAMVLQLWRIIPGPIAVGFGSACLIGAGTWGFVWLGEEILDQLELWRERRRLERMMSEGWGRGGGTGGSGGESDK